MNNILKLQTPFYDLKVTIPYETKEARGRFLNDLIDSTLCALLECFYTYQEDEEWAYEFLIEDHHNHWRYIDLIIMEFLTAPTNDELDKTEYDNFVSLVKDYLFNGRKLKLYQEFTTFLEFQDLSLACDFRGRLGLLELDDDWRSICLKLLAPTISECIIGVCKELAPAKTLVFSDQGQIHLGLLNYAQSDVEAAFEAVLNALIGVYGEIAEEGRLRS